VNDSKPTIENTDAVRIGQSGDRGTSVFSRNGEAGASFGKKMMVPLLVGAAFLVIVAISVSGNPSEQSVSTLQDKEANESANQAARAIATDPLGNQEIPDDGPLPVGSDGQAIIPPVAGQGQVVPGIETEQMPPQDPVSERREREYQERQQRLREAEARRDAIRRAPVMALSSGRTADSQPRNSEVGYQQAESGNMSRQQTALEGRLQSSTIAQVRARTLANRNFLITAGTQIPCVLQTAMDSTLPGFTSCIVPRTVFSDNGRVILLEKGTRVLGEYQGGLQQGQNRLFVLWNRAITPNGVSIELASPAADSLGRAGASGDVDTFFWKRFGGSLLLSIVGDLGAAASDRVSNARETSRAPNQAAAAALENDIGIPPRLRAPQGSEMTIFVARDVDFSSVYALRLRR
jgi:type IV secretion system protein VirB10